MIRYNKRMAKKIRKGRLGLLVVLMAALVAGAGSGLYWIYNQRAPKSADEQTPDHTQEQQAEANAARQKQEASKKISELKEAEAGTEADLTGLTNSMKKELFYTKKIDDTLLASMEGVTYVSDQDFITPEDLELVRVLYKNFDGKDCIGELIVNHSIAQDTLEVFRELYEAEYPINQIVLPDVYNGDDNLSMAENNTSAFSFRLSDGVGVAEHEHSLGLAIDINPLQNPQVIDNDGTELYFPYLGKEYADRTTIQDHMITHDDKAYQIFTEHGFSWGGDWSERQDYMHFEKNYDPSMFRIVSDTASEGESADPAGSDDSAV